LGKADASLSLSMTSGVIFYHCARASRGRVRYGK
jgi:hypothetical protein